MNREILIKEIIDELSILRYRIESLSESNLNDINIIYEFHIKEILNILYDWKLINSNENNKNSPAIDLEDIENSIAVQVTSTSKKIKIQETLNKFFSNNFDSKFKTLFVFILGKKQNIYTSLKIKENFAFDPSINILDFSDINKRVAFLPNSKIEKVRNILKKDKYGSVRSSNAKNIFKTIQITRKKIVKNLVRSLDTREDLLINYYDPSYSIICDDLIIRSIEDRKYPNFDEDATKEVPSWYKVFSYKIEEYYIEVAYMGVSEIVVNKNNEWNYLANRSMDSIPNDLTIVKTGIIQRILFENIVDIEMENDDPIIYVDYKDGKPFREELPYIRGYYRNENDYQYTIYFELEKQIIKL
ncbi:SMEK domain-containing protein [Chryseobacterium sp. 18068]|uniref:SMEK domain-containing protein n=1 Tax=Chryseobacterium sp. 18068 TaxID=2681414 RepID=UPI00135BE253|nr:SMEK domain-containing protein [Chryseobacterium sp. 18068]